MTGEEFRAAHELCDQLDEPWTEDNGCPACGAALHLASPELERRGVCGDCTAKALAFLPLALDQIALLTIKLFSRTTTIEGLCRELRIALEWWLARSPGIDQAHGCSESDNFATCHAALAKALAKVTS